MGRMREIFVPKMLGSNAERQKVSASILHGSLSSHVGTDQKDLRGPGCKRKSQMN